MTDEVPQKYYTAQEAVAMANEVGLHCTLPTMHTWLAKNKLGIQPGGPGSSWFVYADRFDTFLQGKQEKLHGKN
jgi:hypothetical protein